MMMWWMNLICVRGRATANSAFGNAASVLVGDFIYTRAFQLVAQLQSIDILRIMADATNVLAEGEVQQLMNVNDPDTTEESYMRVIYSKTARLLKWQHNPWQLLQALKIN